MMKRSTKIVLIALAAGLVLIVAGCFAMSRILFV